MSLLGAHLRRLGRGMNADHRAVCELIARTEPLTEKFELGDMRRLTRQREWTARS